MVESLAITLREGIEAALVVGIILAYLHKIDRLALARSVYIGLALAVMASIVAAAAFRVLNIDPENEYLEGTLFGIAGILVGTMVIWMWRTARGMKVRMESKLSDIVGTQGAAAGRAGSFGLLLFTFVMVFREGIETVLFLFAATLGEFSLLNLTGAVLGLGLAALFAMLLIKGSVRINLARFFSVTSFILLLLALRLLAGAIHEFGEIGALPVSADVMRVIGLFVRDSSTTLIMIALLAAPVFMIFWDATGAGRTAPSVNDGATGAARRKQLAVIQRERAWRVGLVAAAMLIIMAMASTVFASGKAVDPAPVPVAAIGDEVSIPLASMVEGQLHKFSFTADGVAVRFIAMRHADGTVHAGLDACQICGGVGYMQEGEHAICKNCNAPILASTIGEGGGCNPLPLPSEVRGMGNGGTLVVSRDALIRARTTFAR